MVKHTQTIHRLLPTNCLSVFDHFVGLALNGLKYVQPIKVRLLYFEPASKIRSSSVEEICGP